MARMTSMVDRGRPLRVTFICQAVDADDPFQPGTIRWIHALAVHRRVDRVEVLALRTGRYEHSPNISVRSFGRSGRVRTLAAFYRTVISALRPRPDFFFVYQGGPYPLLLLPLKLLLRIPIVQWKAHSVVTAVSRFHARWCDDLILTSTRSAFPMALPKVRVVGQGIDTEFFKANNQAPIGDLVAACRVSPIKRIDQMVKAVVHANRRFGTSYRLNVFGPVVAGDEAYAEELESLIDELGAREWIRLRGPVPHHALPALLSGHRACLNFCAGALNRSVVEAMACGLPVVSTNDSVREVLPDDLRPTLITDKERIDVQATAIHEILRKPALEMAELGRRMRVLVEAEHSVDLLFDRILDEVDALLVRRS